MEWHLVWQYGWVDLDFGCYILWLCPPGLLGNWQKWLSNVVVWLKIMTNSKPKLTAQPDVSPCRLLVKPAYLDSFLAFYEAFYFGYPLPPPGQTSFKYRP